MISNDFQLLDSRRDREGGMGSATTPGAERAPDDKDKTFDPDEIPF